VGKVIGEFGWVDLDELLAVVKTDLGELFRSKGGELRIVGPMPKIWGDHDRIGQLFANLISNGIKYNESPNPWVEVKALEGAGVGSPSLDNDFNLITDVTVSIRDNGIGIEPRFHATIFQLFRRLHTRDEYEGTGAGLAICSKIVQAHSGRIWVESALGEGATFFISLRSGSTTTTPSLSVTPAPLAYETAVAQVPVDERNSR